MHGIHCVIFLDERQTLWMRSNFYSLRLLSLRGRNAFQCHHTIQHRIALHRRTFRIFQRRKPIRASYQSGEQRGFREIQLRCAFAKIELRSCLHSVTTGAEVNPVHIKLKNLLLGKLTLDSKCDHRFEQLSAKGAATQRKTITS